MLARKDNGRWCWRFFPLLAFIGVSCSMNEALFVKTLDPNYQSRVTHEELSSYLPKETLDAYREFYTTGGWSSIGSEKGEVRKIPCKGLLAIGMIGVREDTLDDIQLIFQDRRLVEIIAMPFATYSYDADSLWQESWILGQCFHVISSESCFTIVREKYEPFLADTASLGLYDLLATVVDRDSVVVCLE